MKIRTTQHGGRPFHQANGLSSVVAGRDAGFTLAEVLAALLFMAIVVPVSVQALRIATLAGEVAHRKEQAARIAERVLNENIVRTNWGQSGQSGKAMEGFREFEWQLQVEPWNQLVTNQVPLVSSAGGLISAGQPPVNQSAADQVILSLLTVEVKYPVQGQEYTVRLSTLVDSQQR
jgi:hypothetical protein